MTFRKLDGAKCVGMYDLFDSRLLADHVEAKRLCMQCPVRLECGAELRDARADSTGGAAGMPEGTWAGQLVGGKKLIRPQANCGTDSGYSHHRRRGEEACEDCCEARRMAERSRAARRRNQAS